MPQSDGEHHNQDEQHTEQGEEAGDDDQLPGELHLLVLLPPTSLFLPQLLLHILDLNTGAGLSLPSPTRQALGGRSTATGAGAL